MISFCIDAVCLKDLGQFFYLFATKAVNDARLFLIIFDKFDNFLINIDCFGTYFVL